MESESQNRFSKAKRLIKDNVRLGLDHLWKTQDYNIQTFRQQPLQEISGSFGDLGTLLPILIAYTDVGRYPGPAIDLSSTLVFTGLFNIITGVVFGIPLPVQPMKAIAAIALSRLFRKEEVASAGLFVAAIVAFSALLNCLNGSIAGYQSQSSKVFK